MKYTIAFAALFALIASIIGTTSSMNMPVYAQENEAEVEVDIEQENKCKKDTECENENEINNVLSITNITNIGQQNGDEEQETSPCEDCFTTILTPEQQAYVLANAEQGDTFAEICEFLEENPNSQEESQIVYDDIGGIPNITEEQHIDLFNCLVDSGVIEQLLG